MPSRTLLLEAGTMVEEETGSRSTRNRPATALNVPELGKGLGTKLVRALVELLFSDPGGH